MKRTSLLICASMLALVACFSPTANLYQSEKTPGVDFNNYKTYAWLPTKDTAFTTLASKKTVESALAQAVASS
jgi:hypothetical protein